MSDQLHDTASPPVTVISTTEPPATYRDTFSNREFRGLFAASALSWFGDYIARAAITALVYDQTHSVLTSAAAFALSYLPWLAGGPVLAALADRYPYRRVMIICDLVRILLVGIVALPGMPVWAMFALMFLAAMASPPFDAARSALLSRVLSGRRYVLGVSLQTSALQCAQILGYAAGGMVVVAASAHLALAADAVTFGISALLIALSIQSRQPAIAAQSRRSILHETAEGVTIVFGRPVPRAIAIVVFAGLTFIAVPEGLAAGWAADLHATSKAQGLIMAAAPAGMALGGLLLPRLTPAENQRRVMQTLVVLAPLALVPALLHPPLFVVISMVLLSGFAFGGFSPIANGLFVQALPVTHRARAFGVMSASMQLIQGAALLAAGAATRFAGVPVVIGTWCTAGIVLMLVTSLAWPTGRAINAAIAETKATHNAPAELAR